MRSLLAVLLLALLLVACGDNPPTQTPFVIVVTATAPPAATVPVLPPTTTRPAQPTGTPDRPATQQAVRLATIAALNEARATEGAVIHATETEAARPTDTPRPPTDTPLPPPLSKSSIEATRLQAGFQPANFDAGTLLDYVKLTVTYQSHLNRAVRTFRGTLTLYDPFGKLLNGYTVTVTDPLAAGGSVVWNGQIENNPYIAVDQQIRQYAQSGTLGYDWSLTQVLYQDGSREDVP